MIPTIQAVTVAVTNLARSKAFYEDVLGLEPDSYYEPTRWQSYASEGRAYFCITEETGLTRPVSKDIINFDVDDLDGLWARVKDACHVEMPLQTMPWGTRKFVLRDPDGLQLAFCA